MWSRLDVQELDCSRLIKRAHSIRPMVHRAVSTLAGRFVPMMVATCVVYRFKVAPNSGRILSAETKLRHLLWS